MTEALYINGRFLTQKTTGVQRFGTEVVKAMDAQLAAQKHRREVVLLTPHGEIGHLDLKTIRVEQFGRLRGHLWEQLELPFRAAGAPLLSLCNAGPVMHRRQLVVIHDAAVFREPQAYSRVYASAHRALGRILKRTATLATVSEFSRRELASVLRLDSRDMIVAPNGGEHIGAVKADDGVLTRLGLEGAPFFLVVGSPSPHKNTDLAVEAARQAERWGAKTVLVGQSNPKIFGQQGYAAQSAVVLAGRVSDGELKSLYENALALVFASRYEGFGIPLIEAMHCGCPIIASNIPASREVCGEAAQFVPVGRLDALVNAMERQLRSPPAQASSIANLAAFSWPLTARKLLQAAASLR